MTFDDYDSHAKGRGADRGSLQQRAIATIKPLIPADAKVRVERAVEQYNRLVREQIREATGLRLADENGRGSVPVRVVDGFPAAVAWLINEHDDRILWLLVTIRPQLDRMTTGLSSLLENWPKFRGWDQLPAIAKGKDTEPALELTWKIGSALQNLAEAQKIMEEIEKIHEDILGAYYHSGPQTHRVEIYWMAQGLFAAAFGVTIEDLTLVTLAHELAHAYTHLGRDIDGVAWSDDGFARSESAVVEGLAQFYTSTIANRLRGRSPAMFETYRTVLAHQSGPYRAHETWFEPSPARSSEIVRLAMLQARNLGTVTDAAWRDILNDALNALARS